MLGRYKIREADGTIRELKKEEWDALFAIPGLMFWNCKENIEIFLDTVWMEERYLRDEVSEQLFKGWLEWNGRMWAFLRDEFKKYTGKDLVIG